MRKLAIITSHPIQYNAPWFKMLAEKGKIDLKVFYTWEQSSAGAKYDPGFGRKIDWDIPLLEGYNYEFVSNVSQDPGTHHFKGIVNPELIATIIRWKPDCILIFGWSFTSHLKCLRYFKGKIPVLFRGDSTLIDEQNGFKKIIRRIFLRWVYTHVDHALYVGEKNKEYFLALGLKSKQLTFAPHAIDNNRFSDSTANYSEIARKKRIELGIQDEDLVLLFAGKFESKKNPFSVLHILKKIPDQRFKVVFVGNGELENELKQAAANDNRVFFMPFQNQLEMPIIYRMGDIFILPSNGPNETWGLAVNEAMASSRPVIVSEKAGCCEDLVRDGMNGLPMNKNNEEDVVGFLYRSLSDKRSLKEMGDISKSIIDSYSFSKIVSAVEDLVENVAN